ncbi:DUF1115 domain containing protein [Nitzschia inconspicua]|uniref:DUF1115 domain containing protein n=1 Tax=Nitzschia inconspicua TaxID=303405 RepID=A0A9K3PQV4_9STRA|nr:DUF1115 domain containing protein [Nitzschia inconspicua]
MSSRNNILDDVHQECQERRDAELEFVSSAYEPEEAWWDHQVDTILIHRQLRLESSASSLLIRLILQMSPSYPVMEPLQVMDVKLLHDTQISSISNSSSNNNNLLQKTALNSFHSLLQICRSTAIEHTGEESVFAVLNAAEEWVRDQWPKILRECNSKKPENNQNKFESAIKTETNVLGRRLIYSHHIIAKKKRADIKALAAHYELTGYMKIGWPGLLLIEGDEQDCIHFCDEIRPWSWQYLVVRGEQQQQVPIGKSMESLRRFAVFSEVEDMSVVAEHCKKVGLEALFRTSMKQYRDSTEEEDSTISTKRIWYGALVLVDHMNYGKKYRKWLRKCSQEVGCFLFIKQFFPGNDYTNRPKIYVGLIGEKANVSSFLKRWRTSRVDVDCKGNACLERQMTILTEGVLDGNYEIEDPSEVMDWDTMSLDENITVDEENLDRLLMVFGWTLTST